ncbi:unnamed protein product [Ambrosiozyma monospora]|uniref:Unnamed protein product n=1 Tax=Ambrosiozyma monospora TaxID=43982 RepID=A0A9W6YTJ6_AMBMO|nr:unnamed protein product [Ambrosiozyma monospora]
MGGKDFCSGTPNSEAVPSYTRVRREKFYSAPVTCDLCGTGGTEINYGRQTTQRNSSILIPEDLGLGLLQWVLGTMGTGKGVTTNY